MIADDPDEDADELDDGAVFEQYLGDSSSRQDSASSDVATLPDWPYAVRDVGLNLDAETLAWFKAKNINWRSAMRSVLRAWVVANERIEVATTAPVEAGQT
jgi:uncharacterized protein (DUF4415 family)